MTSSERYLPTQIAKSSKMSTIVEEERKNFHNNKKKEIIASK